MKNSKYIRKDICFCLYCINKEAKRQRDFQRIAAKNNDKHEVLFRREKKDLYSLKRKVLEKLISLYDLKPLGYNIMKCGNKKNGQRYDLYEIDGYLFHNEEAISNTFLGDIQTEISSYTSCKYNLEEVRNTLEIFLENKIILFEKAENQEEVA